MEPEIPKYIDEIFPNAYTQEELFEKTIPKIAGIYSKLNYDQLVTQVYQQKDLEIGMTIMNNVWSMCTKNILMIDFDFKVGLTKDKALNMIRAYTEYMHINYKIDLLFQNYDTDRGLHSFLVNKKMDHLSRDAMRVMIDLHNDADYIGFVVIKGFCIRIGPKFIGKSNEEIQESINKEFIAKPVEGKDFRIGYGEPNYYIERVLDVHLELINWFLDQYRTRLIELRSKRYIAKNDKYDFYPPDLFMDEVKKKTIDTLTKWGIKDVESKYTLNISPTIREFPQHNYRVYEQSGLVLYYDLYSSIWVMCTPNILMVDFDEGDGFTREDAINRLQKFASSEAQQQRPILFNVYSTDKGIHAFVMNKYISYDSPESVRILSNLGNDAEHIRFTQLGTHCIRLSPKLFRNRQLQTRNEVLSEFVSKKCYLNSCTIGNAIPIQYIKSILLLHDHMISYIKSLYRDHFEDMISKVYSPQINDVAYIPKPEFIQEIRSTFMNILTDLNLLTNDTTFRATTKPANASRYTGLAEDKLISACVSKTSEETRKIGMDITNSSNPKVCRNKTDGVHGPEVPFNLYRDNQAKLLILTEYDIAMLDFDAKDGVEKQNVSRMLERFVNSQKVLPENFRITKSDMCFKLYETDNGVHAFVVSHPIPFYTEQATRLQLETCSDNLYAAFSSSNGYSIRMSPKLFISNYSTQLNTSEVIQRQFIQKPGVNGVMYVGDTKNIDPYVEEYVDMIYNIQQYVLNFPNMINMMTSFDDEILYQTSKYARTLYMNMKNKRDDRYAKRWAMNTLNCK